MSKIDHEYCKNCQEQLGLYHMVASDDYIQGAVDAVVELYKKDLAILKDYSGEKEVMRLAMIALRGHANPKHVLGLIKAKKLGSSTNGM